ncbi:MAG: FAD-dependent monooxygenase [Pseudomonadales bacterium]|nr:FAD-dependent monooxygenase [Pseudomonadales bacterium]
MNIGIVGGGIGGLTAAVALSAKGFDVDVFEQAPAFGKVGAGISIAANALSVYARLGLVDAIVRRGAMLNRAIIENHKGTLLSTVDLQRAGQATGFCSIGISRSALHHVLVSALPRERLYCGHRLVSASPMPGGITLAFDNGERRDFDVVIGADGLHSSIRRELFGDSPVRAAGQHCWRGIVKRSAVERDDIATDSGVEIWGVGRRFGHVPIGEDSIYWYATLCERAIDFEVSDFARLPSVFSMFPDRVSSLLAATPDEAISSLPLLDKVPTRQWHVGRVVLLGDSVHPTTPNMGQGACMAVESAWVLAQCLARAHDVECAFTQYAALRRARTASVTTRSFRLGRLAQPETRFGAGVRDGLARLIPDALQESMFRDLLAGVPGDETSPDR